MADVFPLRKCNKLNESQNDCWFVFYTTKNLIFIQFTKFRIFLALPCFVVGTPVAVQCIEPDGIFSCSPYNTALRRVAIQSLSRFIWSGAQDSCSSCSRRLVHKFYMAARYLAFLSIAGLPDTVGAVWCSLAVVVVFLVFGV